VSSPATRRCSASIWASAEARCRRPTTGVSRQPMPRDLRPSHAPTIFAGDHITHTSSFERPMPRIDVLSIQRLGSADKAKIEAIDPAAVNSTECRHPSGYSEMHKRAGILGLARPIVAQRTDSVPYHGFGPNLPGQEKVPAFFPSFPPLATTAPPRLNGARFRCVGVEANFSSRQGNGLFFPQNDAMIHGAGGVETRSGTRGGTHRSLNTRPEPLPTLGWRRHRRSHAQGCIRPDASREAARCGSTGGRE